MDEFVLMPVDLAKQKLSQMGYQVSVLVNSLPKINVDAQLVTAVRQSGKQVQLVVGDFKIGVGDGTV